MTPRSTPVLAEYLNGNTIPHDFTAQVTTVARAGYEAFTRDRAQSRPWEQLRAVERFRWQLAADLMWDHLGNNPPVNAKAIRHRYHLLTDAGDWTQMKAEYRNRWQAVYVAMERVVLTLRGAERMVISA